jgi:hypothetical protein
MGERMRGPGIAENASYAHDHRGDQDDEPEDDHGALRTSTLLVSVNAMTGMP